MSRIIELGEASGVFGNDYVLLSSPTAGERKFLADNFRGSGGTSAIYLTQAQYDALTTEEKANGTIYFVEQDESDWTFVHTQQNSSAYKYSEVPDSTIKLLAVVSLNNVVYAGIHFTVAGQVARVLTASEQSSIATALRMTSTYASGQTIGGSGTSVVVNDWREGNNHDKLYLSESSLSNVGTKVDYDGCKSHLFYKTAGARKIYYNNMLWSNISV